MKLAPSDARRDKRISGNGNFFGREMFRRHRCGRRSVSHDDRDGGIQFIALFTGSRHRNDKFAVFLSDKILGRIR